MNIALVGAGLIEIPPRGYGAVESIIADQTYCFEQLGHRVSVYNERDAVRCVDLVNAGGHDVVWVHDDRKVMVMDKFNCPARIITSHDPMLFERFNPKIPFFTAGTFQIGCLTEKHLACFKAHGVAADRLFWCPNGARPDLQECQDQPDTDALICLGQVCDRKRQHLLTGLPVKFAGPVSKHYDQAKWSTVKPNWLGEWTKAQVRTEMKKFGALVLLARHEAAPCVVPEAMMSGLPVIVSEAAAANLPPATPFACILPEREISNPVVMAARVTNFMKAHRADLTSARRKIRAFAENYFDWSKLLLPVTDRFLWHRA